MKKLLIILLVFIFANQTARYFYVKTYEVCFVLEVEEKDEKSGEEKNEKENLQIVYSHKAAIPIEDTFHYYSCRPHVAPVVDHISPPPDAIV